MASAKWNKNQDLKDLQDNATTYNSATTDYSSTTVYYNGYDPTTETPEGEAPAKWTREAE